MKIVCFSKSIAQGGHGRDFYLLLNGSVKEDSTVLGGFGGGVSSTGVVISQRACDSLVYGGTEGGCFPLSVAAAFSA